jgi:long-subunit acyl-CoA synthetase (AMP-forming)
LLMLPFLVGYINPATGDLFITGRAKDTIVLRLV